MKRMPVVEVLGLSGKLQNQVICRTRTGKAYLRSQGDVPKPESARQKEQQRQFKLACAAWKALSKGEKEAYQGWGEWSGRSGYNLFLSEYLRKGNKSLPLVPQKGQRPAPALPARELFVACLEAVLRVGASGDIAALAAALEALTQTRRPAAG
ncbi:MAG: hypothetical protein HY898_18310 [Deltaproteobacteria bacterium]|nr:hypothetical protein [Deltaproteobacteria bacterium]